MAWTADLHRSPTGEHSAEGPKPAGRPVGPSSPRLGASLGPASPRGGARLLPTDGFSDRRPASVPRRLYSKVAQSPRLVAQVVTGSATMAWHGVHSVASVASPRIAQLQMAAASALSSPRLKHVRYAVDRLAERQESIRAAARRRVLMYATATVGVLLSLVSVVLLLMVTTPKTVAPMTAYETACSVFCEGRVLQAVQMARVFPDSKTFVDMPLLVDPDTVEAAFSVSFPDFPARQPSKVEVVEFLGRFFAPAGSDMLPWVPDDWDPTPPMLMAVRNDTVRGWLLGLNELWLSLGRQLAKDVRAHPERHTLIWQPNPLIVPGGRFIETYYWDSFWIVLGLLRSGMVDTASKLVGNMEHLLSTFGFLPNGSRTYYALPGRSQPPVLSSMVAEVYAATGNISFLREAYSALKTEWDWWMQAGEYGHAVFVATGDPSGAVDSTADASSQSQASHRRGSTFVLNRYVSDQHIPRPESYAEDVHTAAHAGHGASDPEAQILYSEIAAAAESGWDFTGRWFGDGYNISTCETSHVIPVELNTLMYILESDLAQFAEILSRADREACGLAATPQEAAEAHMEAAAEEHGSVPGPVVLSGSASAPGAEALRIGRAAGEAVYQPSQPMPQGQGQGTGQASKAREKPAQAPIFSATPSPSAPTEPDIVYCKRHPKAPVCQPGRSDVVRDLMGPRRERAHWHVSWSIAEGLEVEQQTSQGPVGRCNPMLALALADDAARFAAAASERARAMEALMWDEGAGMWTDLRIAPDALTFTEPVGPGHAVPTGTERGAVHVHTRVAQRYRARTDLVMGRTVTRSKIISASNYVPLWAGLGLGPGGDALPSLPPSGSRPEGSVNRTRVLAIIDSFGRSGLAGPAGIASTTARTPEQWDWPNAWAPTQHQIILGLQDTGVPEAQTVARELARRWLSSGLKGFLATAPKRGGTDVRISSTGQGAGLGSSDGAGQGQGGSSTVSVTADGQARVASERAPEPSNTTNTTGPVGGLTPSLDTAVPAPGEDTVLSTSPDGVLHVPPAGFMFEKYDATAPGSSGSKGEYEPQTGFGWTNGVALDLAVRFDFQDLDTVDPAATALLG